MKGFLVDSFDRMCGTKRNMPILVIWVCFISSARSDVTLHSKRNTINNNERFLALRTSLEELSSVSGQLNRGSALPLSARP